MSKPHERDDYMNWTQPGQVIVMATQCDACSNRERNPKICTAYPEGKPRGGVRVEQECPEFQAVHTKRDRVRGGLFGLAVGDALGVPVEFNPRHRLKESPVTTMMGYGTFHQPPGTWSDDSSMVFCLAESLCGSYNLHDIGNRFVRWYRESYWTPHGVVFDIGNATSRAIQALHRGMSPLDAGGKTEYDNGNGSLMRILPLAYFLEQVDDAKERIRIIHEVSSITHGHLRSQIACTIYVEMALQLLKGLPPHLAYVRMQENVRSYYDGKNSETAQELQHYSRILNEEIFRKPEESIRSSGYVVDTLEAALWCFLRKLSYQSTVLAAVNLGEDTDTVAAVAGGLAGLYYGYEEIPQEWLNTIARRDDIAELCERFYQAI